MSCTYCGKVGHLEIDCYNDFEFTKIKCYLGLAKANGVTTGEEIEKENTEQEEVVITTTSHTWTWTKINM